MLHGLKPLTLRMEHHAQNTLEIARYLEQHPATRQVIYPPGLPRRLALKGRWSGDWGILGSGQVEVLQAGFKLLG